MDTFVKSNVRSFMKNMNDTKKQMAFATSKAINDTTKDARLSIIKREKGKGRKAWFYNKKYGIRRRFANKKKLRGEIFTTVYWAKLQEKGGIKRPKGKVIAVPTQNMAKSNRKAGGLRKLLNQKTTFIHPKLDGVYRRVGGKKSRKVKKLAVLTKRAHIDKPDLKFRETAHKVTVRRFNRYHRRAVRKALETRR